MVGFEPTFCAEPCPAYGDSCQSTHRFLSRDRWTILERKRDTHGGEHGDDDGDDDGDDAGDDGLLHYQWCEKVWISGFAAW